MADKTYWLAGPSGEKAVVEGDAEDRLFPHGWRETSEPVDGDIVWMSHPDVEKPGAIPWAAREYWQGIGWAPSAPPAPVNPAVDPVLTDTAPGELVAQKADSRRTTKTTAAPAAPSKEE